MTTEFEKENIENVLVPSEPWQEKKFNSNLKHQTVFLWVF